MSGEHRLLRRGLIVAAGVAVVGGTDVWAFSVVARASASPTTAFAVASTFQVANGTANAGADYVVYFNGAFPNFTPGIVASSFPLSHVHLDNAPFTEATSAPVDTGPAGGTSVGAWNANAPSGAPHLSQPQYAESRYPPGSAKPATFGNPGGPSASATATATGASASATVADTTQAGSSPGSASSARALRISQFNSAMRAWRLRFLGLQAAAAHPASASASTPDGTDGDSSTASVSETAAGALVVTGDSRLQQAVFGGGALMIHGVHTVVSITNSGSPKATTTVSIGDASVGGVPVSITSSGVALGPSTVPADQVQTATAQLNAILAAAGITVTTLAPIVKTSTSQETVTASALAVTIDQPGPPEQTVRHNLGNVFADDLAIPASQAALAVPAVSSLGGAPLGAAPSGPQTQYIPGTAGTPAGQGGAPAAGTPAAHGTPSNANGAALAGLHVKPTWLLVGYLLWQVLVLGAAASMWWWRKAGRAVV